MGRLMNNYYTDPNAYIGASGATTLSQCAVYNIFQLPSEIKRAGGH